MSEKQRKIFVTEHAMIQYQERKRDFRPYSVIEDEIKTQISASFASGRVRNHRPKGFLLYGRNNKSLPEGQRIALNEDESIGWVVKKEEDTEVVLTTLTRTGVNH